MATRVTEDQIAVQLTHLPGWSHVEGAIEKTYAFGSYKDGLVFGVAVGYLADAADHHPDLLIGYRKVRVRLNTHDVGGISELDFSLAARIEALSVA